MEWKSERISAFADEIGPDFELQLDVLASNDVGNIELRGAWDRGVLSLSGQEIANIRRMARSAGIGFSAIGSPIGKSAVDGPFAVELENLRWSIDVAETLSAPFVRVFSYYVPFGEDASAYRLEVIDRMRQLAFLAEQSSVRLVLENERFVYGDTAERIDDIHSSVSSAALVAAFDPANFVQVGEEAWDCWERVGKYVGHFHVKDARRSTCEVTPAGEGDGQIGRILKAAYSQGYDGFLTLEPHLTAAFSSGGITSVEQFSVATRALRVLVEEIPETSRRRLLE